MTRPTLGFYVAFADDPFAADSTLTWTDITAYVLPSTAPGGSAVTIDRGRNAELGRVEAGTLRGLRLDNRDRRFDPNYAAGAYYPNVRPMKRLQVRAVWNSITYKLYTGYVEAWEPIYPGGMQAVVEVRASDWMKAIGRTTVTISTIAPGEITGNGIRTALDQIGFPLTDYDGLNVGQSRVLPSDFVNQNTLQYIQNIVETENGLFFIKGSGLASFQDRHYRLKHAVSAATFGDSQIQTNTLFSGCTASATTLTMTNNGTSWPTAGTVLIDSEQITYTGLASFNTQLTGCTRGANGTTAATHSAGAAITPAELLYEDVRLTYDEQLIYNVVRVNREGGTEQEAADTASEASYGPRVLSKSGLYLQTDTETLSMAQWLLYGYKDPIIRAESLVLNGNMNPSGLWPQILGRELSDAIAVVKTPPGSTVTILLTTRIEHISLALDSTVIRATWQLSTTVNEDWMILDDPIYGVLDSSHRLAF